MLMRQRDDLMLMQHQQGDRQTLMHQQLQDDRLMRLDPMQLNERVRGCCWTSGAGGYDCVSPPAEPPSKKRRVTHDGSYGYKENRRPSESWHLVASEQDQQQQPRQQLPQQLQLRPPQQRQKQQRRVRFSETSQAVILPARTSEELNQCWLTKSDVAGYKRLTKIQAASLSATRTAKLLKHVAYLAATTHGDRDKTGDRAPSPTPQDAAASLGLGGRIDAVRGMEHLVCPTVARLLIQRRRAVLLRVLEEQERVRGREDGGAEERIARAAREASSFSREWSRRVLGLHREVAP